MVGKITLIATGKVMSNEVVVSKINQGNSKKGTNMKSLPFFFFFCQKS